MNRSIIKRTLIIIVLFVVAIGGGLVLGHVRRAAKSSIAPLQTQQQFMKKIGDAISKQFAPDYVTDTSTWDAENTDPGKTLTGKGYDFAISSSALPQLQVRPAHLIKGNGIVETNFVPAHTANEVYGFVAEWMRDHYGFTERTDGARPDDTATNQLFNNLGQGGETTTFTLARKQQTCEATWTTYYLTLFCRDPDVERVAAAQLAPFVSLYAAHHTVTGKTVFGPLSIKSQDKAVVRPIGRSDAAGYDIAELLIHSGDHRALALFYAKGNTWHFITEASDEFGFNCTDIQKDPDARKAFHGQICYLPSRGQIYLDTGRSWGNP